MIDIEKSKIAFKEFLKQYDNDKDRLSNNLKIALIIILTILRFVNIAESSHISNKNI